MAVRLGSRSMVRCVPLGIRWLQGAASKLREALVTSVQ